MIRETTSLTDPNYEEQPEGFAIWLMRGVFRLDHHVQDFELRISEIEARLGLLPRAKTRDLGYEPGEDDLF